MVTRAEVIERLTWEAIREGKMGKRVEYSDGSVVENAVVVIWDDLHVERAGYYRAFWAASPDATTGSPVIGYASAGGSHRTIRAVVAEVRRYYPGEKVYRNGREAN
jgi:hypothetical protein